MKSLRERTEIQQAYLDGKQVQVSDDGIKWRDPINLCFDSWNCVDYRIKPKPMVEYIAFYRDVQVGRSNDRDFLAENLESFDRIVKMVEQPE